MHPPTIIPSAFPDPFHSNGKPEQLLLRVITILRSILPCCHGNLLLILPTWQQIQRLLHMIAAATGSCNTRTSKIRHQRKDIITQSLHTRNLPIQSEILSLQSLVLVNQISSAATATTAAIIVAAKVKYRRARNTYRRRVRNRLLLHLRWRRHIRQRRGLWYRHPPPLYFAEELLLSSPERFVRELPPIWNNLSKSLRK
uniref:Uncharacterized protein n=1 Tax=Opuntia streptacantha TaxID=393608 RepID=A0A7C8YWI9_OPUST